MKKEEIKVPCANQGQPQYSELDILYKISSLAAQVVQLAEQSEKGIRYESDHIRTQTCDSFDYFIIAMQSWAKDYRKAVNGDV